LSSGNIRLTRAMMRAEGLTAEVAISMYKVASIRREFPRQFLTSTLDEMEEAARSHDAAARRALRLLFDRRFDKP
jgi:hypothetical protein